MCLDSSRLCHKVFPHVFHTSLDSKKNAGTAIFIKYSVAFTHSDTILDPKGHYMILKCLLNSSPFTLVSLYAPNTHQILFLSSVINPAKKLAHCKLIVAGNLSAVADKNRDRSDGCAKSSLELQTFFHEDDIWRYQHANKCDYTNDSYRYRFLNDIFFIDNKSLLRS